MTYTRDGDKVTIEMTLLDFEQLLMLLGFSLGSISLEQYPANFWNTVKFVNELNSQNPNFDAYFIPEEYR